MARLIKHTIRYLRLFINKYNAVGRFCATVGIKRLSNGLTLIGAADEQVAKNRSIYQALFIM